VGTLLGRPRRRAFASPAWAGLWVADLVGAALVIVSGAIHLDLYARSYYQHVPTIGVLFVAQAVTALVVALAILSWRSVAIVVIGAGLMASTLAGYLISNHFGLFGFKDSLQAHFGYASLAVEAAGTVVLLGAAVARLRSRP
jgi:hypothetical protein